MENNHAIEDQSTNPGTSQNFGPASFPFLNQYQSPPGFLINGQPIPIDNPVLQTGSLLRYSSAVSSPAPTWNMSNVSLCGTSSTNMTTTTVSASTNERKRAPHWTPLEEELLIKVYKECSEPLRKKGKKGQVLWKEIASKLHVQGKEFGITTERTGPKVKDKFFNLSKKYKLAKDKTKISGEGSDPIKDCPHFDTFDEFMGSKDAISPKYVIESSLPDVTKSPSSCESSEYSGDVSESDADSTKTYTGKGKGPAESAQSSDVDDPKTKQKKRQKPKNQDMEEKWFALFEQQNEIIKESQKREQQLFAQLQKSEESSKDLIVTAIRELGSLFKKD